MSVPSPSKRGSTPIPSLEAFPSTEEEAKRLNLRNEVALLRPKRLIKQFFRLKPSEIQQVISFCQEISSWCDQQLVLPSTTQVRTKDVSALFDDLYGKIGGFFTSVHQLLSEVETGLKAVANDIYQGVKAILSHISAADITVVFDVTAALVTFVLSMNFPVLTPFIPLLLGLEAVLGHITVNDFHTVFSWLIDIEKELARFVKKSLSFTCFS